jgi:hypothetical protein
VEQAVVGRLRGLVPASVSITISCLPISAAVTASLMRATSP